MTKPRLPRDTGSAFVRSETDGAEERSRADRDRASHLLPRRWRPRKVGPSPVSLTEEFADRAESSLVARRLRI